MVLHKIYAWWANHVIASRVGGFKHFLIIHIIIENALARRVA